jgi:dipeptidyl-peptidase 4
MKSEWTVLQLLPLLLLLLSPQGAETQQASPRMLAEYERAVQRLPAYTDTLVLRAEVRPEWLEADRFWYRVRTAEGHEFILVDPARGTRERAFDHERLAQALTAATGTTYSPWSLPVERLTPVQDGRRLGFELERRRWECDVIEYRCERPATEVERLTDAVLSPDGRYAAFRRDHDLWVREQATGNETRLTTDGVARYGYATDNEGWRRSERPAVTWSPDGARLLTYRVDERGVGDLHLLEMAVGRPLAALLAVRVAGRHHRTAARVAGHRRRGPASRAGAGASGPPADVELLRTPARRCHWRHRMVA